MSAEVRYLSQRSLAVYEATMIAQFAETHKRNIKIQTFVCTVFCLSFIALALLAILLPAGLQDFVGLLLTP